MDFLRTRGFTALPLPERPIHIGSDDPAKGRHADLARSGRDFAAVVVQHRRAAQFGILFRIFIK